MASIVLGNQSSFDGSTLGKVTLGFLDSGHSRNPGQLDYENVGFGRFPFHKVLG